MSFGAGKFGMKKLTHEAGASSKIDLRRRVLAEVPNARVLDCFCGPRPAGSMWAGAWREADRYVGIDLQYEPRTEERARYVGDTRRVLRNLDLGEWNIFDIDSFGEPWEVAIVLAARRRWAKGELGALVVTDGGAMKLKTGRMSWALQELLGLAAKGEPTGKQIVAIHRAALLAVLERMKVKPRRLWMSEATGISQMRYSAVVFEGRG